MRENQGKAIPSTTVLLASAILAILLGACGGGGGSPTEPAGSGVSTVNVAFVYLAASAIDPAVDFLTCTPQQARFSTHLHFIWNSWDDRRTMTAVGDNRFEYQAQVPTNQALEVALHDPNNCLQGNVYIAPATLSANGTPLTQVVNVSQGTGLSLRVAADGVVTP